MRASVYQVPVRGFALTKGIQNLADFKLKLQSLDATVRTAAGSQ